MPDKRTGPAARLPVGRIPGNRNRATSTVKDAFLAAFEQLGGPDGLAQWAAARHRVKGRWVYPNLEAFYTLATKLIPTESLSSGRVDHAHYVAREIAVERRDALPAPAIPAVPVPGRPLISDIEKDQALDAVQVIDFIG